MRERPVYVVLKKGEKVIPQEVAQQNSVKLIKIDEIAFKVLMLSLARTSNINSINILVVHDLLFFTLAMPLITGVSVQLLLHFLVQTPDEVQTIMSQPKHNQKRITAQVYPEADEGWRETFSNFQ